MVAEVRYRFVMSRSITNNDLPVSEMPLTRDRAPERRGETCATHCLTLAGGVYCVIRAKDVSFSTTTVTLSTQDDAVTILSFDGKNIGGGSAALVRVGNESAIVTISIRKSSPVDQSPSIEVVRVDHHTREEIAAPSQIADRPEVVVHIQTLGDLAGALQTWIGQKGSRLSVEGFGIAPPMLPEADIEYRAVLGEDWLSPWVCGGTYCGSRGMGLSLLGMAIRLTGKSRRKFRCSYSATFVDGSTVGPVSNGAACVSKNLAALESIHVEIEAVVSKPRGISSSVDR
jgi:hypothetical protein